MKYYLNNTRCDASKDDLDGESDSRSHEVTNGLLAVLDHKTLWDEYGIVVEVIVCFFF